MDNIKEVQGRALPKAKTGTEMPIREQINYLESLKVQKGWHILHNYILEEVQELTEVILDDVTHSMKDEERRRLEVARLLKKGILFVIDDYIEALKLKEESSDEVVIDDVY